MTSIEKINLSVKLFCDLRRYPITQLLHRYACQHLTFFIALKTEGDAAKVLACDAALIAQQSHWLVRETIGLLRRTFARIDVSSRSLFALID